ncbi:hypothetical protein [Bacteroides salyersiae]|uniref:hypothetical protein n=1 Tax=Bacteroides salyersiae TaxID=291644 RepID=UPI001F02C7D9|nr:hypothetical protein [Bacteroides salyersiae]
MARFSALGTVFNSLCKLSADATVTVAIVATEGINDIPNINIKIILRIIILKSY